MGIIEVQFGGLDLGIQHLDLRLRRSDLSYRASMLSVSIARCRHGLIHLLLRHGLGRRRLQ